MSSAETKTPTAFFCSDGAILFDNSLLDGLNRMAQLLHADRLSTIKKSVSSCHPGPKGNQDSADRRQGT